MSFFVRGSGIEKATAYDLMRKVGDTYEKVFGKTFGKQLPEIMSGYINASGAEATSQYAKHTDMIDVTDFDENDTTTQAFTTLSNIMGVSGALLVAFYTKKEDYTSFVYGYSSGELTELWGGQFTGANLVALAKQHNANYVVFTVDVNADLWYYTPNKINFRLDELTDFWQVLTAGETHQLVVKAIGEGGVDLNGDNIIYADSDYSNDVGFGIFTVDMPQEITKGVYINTSLGTTENTSFNIAKVSVKSGMTISISARLGTAAAVCWVDGNGNRTLLGIGNTNEGINFNETVTVPSGAVYLECSYASHLPCTITKQSYFIVLSVPNPVSTVSGKYINKDGAEAELSAMSYDVFNVLEGQLYHIYNRNGASSAAVTWVASNGNKTVALLGNSNDGVNVNTVVQVPAGISSMIVSYVNSQAHNVTLMREV